MRLTTAQVEHLRTLEREGGRISPSDVVDDAKHKSSPLHGLFEWSKSLAAEKYWLVQAREILGAAKVLVETETYTTRGPVYVRDTSAGGGQGYQRVEVMRDDPDQARESLIYTLGVASGHLRRAYDLAEPLGLQAEIDHLVEQVVGVQRVLRRSA